MPPPRDTPASALRPPRTRKTSTSLRSPSTAMPVREASASTCSRRSRRTPKYLITAWSAVCGVSGGARRTCLSSTTTPTETAIGTSFTRVTTAYGGTNQRCGAFQMQTSKGNIDSRGTIFAEGSGDVSVGEQRFRDERLGVETTRNGNWIAGRLGQRQLEWALGCGLSRWPPCPGRAVRRGEREQR